jgi:predicted patatin/cPLA2 family phospholipase
MIVERRMAAYPRLADRLTHHKGYEIQWPTVHRLPKQAAIFTTRARVALTGHEESHSLTGDLTRRSPETKFSVV